MPREYIELGSAPYDEQCAQVGDDNYATNAMRECRQYIQAIRNYLGQEPDGAELGVKRFNHEYGGYWEVVVYYDSDDEKAAEYAQKCEAKAPATWADGGVTPPVLERGGRVR